MHEAGKGDSRRPEDTDKFRDNWEKIFGEKWKVKQQQKEEKRDANGLQDKQ